MPGECSNSFFLEGPDTYCSGWGVLSCSGFSNAKGSDEDYNEVILRCADKATMKLHKAKDAQIASRMVPQSMFFVQWDTAEDDLVPGGMYEFVWERNGEVMVVSKMFDFKDHASEEQQKLRNPANEEILSYNQVRATLRPPKPTWFEMFTKMAFVARIVLLTLLSLFMKIPSIFLSASISCLRLARWSFRQYIRERQVACACGTLCRPFGLFAGEKCTRTTSWIWIRSLLSALIVFWFVRNGASPIEAQLAMHKVKGGNIASLMDVSAVAATKVAAAYDTVAGPVPKGGKPAPAGKKWGLVWEAVVALLQPIFWVLRTAAWIAYWTFGLMFPALFSWAALSLTMPTPKCCKCVAEAAKCVPATAGGKAPKPAIVVSCRACKQRA
mmetsp:Transcript_35952/g.91901  ORF Transcript_35952/g.91901 Transcript_35952/m.91901 type:complete len:384 (-) Transcript_35952:47-1198(-)